MKRILGVVVALAMVASCLVGFEVSAAEVVLDGGFVVDGTVLVRYEGNDTHVVIPEGITRISMSAFYGYQFLKSVSIPNSVRTIDPRAFVDTSIDFIYIPDSVTTLGMMGYGDGGVYRLFSPFDDYTTLIVSEDSYAHEWCVEHEKPYVIASVISFDSMSDVFNMLKLIVSDFPLSEAQVAVADLNGDNKLTAADALAAMKSIMNK